MTYYQDNLFEEALDMWSRGFDIPLDLASKMASEGMDIVALEIKHKMEPQ